MNYKYLLIKMEELYIIPEIIGKDNYPNEEQISFSNLETNQDIQFSITSHNIQVEPPENLSLYETGRLNSNDRNTSIELIHPFLGRKRLRKTFKIAKRK